MQLQVKGCGTLTHYTLFNPTTTTFNKSLYHDGVCCVLELYLGIAEIIQWMAALDNVQKTTIRQLHKPSLI